MDLFDLPIMGALKKRMQFHNARHVVLSENIANAETPGYSTRDLKQPDFGQMMRADKARPPSQVGLPARTDSGHLAGLSTNSRFRSENTSSFETTPEGNAVNLEEEMMKVAQNQIDHQMAASVYSRGMGIIKMAIGRGA